MMNVQRIINSTHNVYIFVCPSLPYPCKRVLIEANSITNAINHFFETINFCSDTFTTSFRSFDT